MNSTFTQQQVRLLQTSEKSTSNKNLIKTTILGILVLTGFISKVQAQYSGTLTVPSTAFPTLKAAVDSLNLLGISGNTTVVLTAANPQTLTGTGNLGGGVIELGSATLNASMTGRTLTFNGNGNVITGHVGGFNAGTTTPTFTTVVNQDVMWAIKGTDNVTINNFTFTDPATNTTNITAIETAIGMFNLSGVPGSMDGCQNINITNCTFNLQDVGTNGHTIYGMPSLFNATTNLSWTSESDKIKNITVSSCTFNEGFDPFWIRGSSADVSAKNIKFLNNTCHNTGGGPVSCISYGVGMMHVDTLDMIGNNINTDIDASNTSTIYGTYPYYCGGLVNYKNNNVQVRPRAAGSHYGHYVYLYKAALVPPVTTLNYKNNNFDVLASTYVGTASSTPAIYGHYTYGYTYNNTIFNYENSFANIDSNTVVNDTFPGSSTNYPMYFGGATSAALGIQQKIRDNTVENLTFTGNGGTKYLIYVPSGNNCVITRNKMNNIKFNNTVSSATTVTMYALLLAKTNTTYDSIYNNTVTNIDLTRATTTTTSLYGIYAPNSSNARIFNNKVHKLISQSSVSTTNTNTVIGLFYPTGTGTVHSYNNVVDSIYAGGLGSAQGIQYTGTGVMNFYNNSIDELYAPQATSVNAVIGAYTSSTGVANFTNNSISFGRLAAITSSATTFGGTGILYNTGNTNLKNNIINIKGTPGSTGGSFSTIRKLGAGTSGVKPANFSGNNNTYHVNTNNNNYIYSEGTTAASLVNAYYINSTATNPVGTFMTAATFNGACSPYKSFMQGEISTFTEDNLATASAVSYAYTPTGSTLSEGSAEVLSFASPDLNNVTRAAFPDRGALEFGGTAIDLSAPVMSFTPLSDVNCFLSPTISVAIADNTGINTSANTKPRMYYRKTTDATSFGANTSAGSGWKWVEASNAASPFNFTFDWSKFATTFTSGDTITYFFTAQDNVSTPNIGINTASLIPSASCPSSVDIGATAGITDATSPFRFVFGASPTISFDIKQPIVCSGAADTIKSKFNLSRCR